MPNLAVTVAKKTKKEIIKQKILILLREFDIEDLFELKKLPFAVPHVRLSGLSASVILFITLSINTRLHLLKILLIISYTNNGYDKLINVRVLPRLTLQMPCKE